MGGTTRPGCLRSIPKVAAHCVPIHRRFGADARPGITSVDGIPIHDDAAIQHVSLLPQAAIFLIRRLPRYRHASKIK